MNFTMFMGMVRDLSALYYSLYRRHCLYDSLAAFCLINLLLIGHILTSIKITYTHAASIEIFMLEYFKYKYIFLKKF